MSEEREEEREDAKLEDERIRNIARNKRLLGVRTGRPVNQQPATFMYLYKLTAAYAAGQVDEANAKLDGAVAGGRGGKPSSNKRQKQAEPAGKETQAVRR